MRICAGSASAGARKVGRSAKERRPTKSVAWSATRQDLKNPIAMVASAFTHGLPGASSRSPLGRSAARTQAASCSRRWLIRWIAEATSSRGSPCIPMPRIPSRTTSGRAWPTKLPGRRESWVAVSGEREASGKTGSNTIRQPSAARWRAATRTSPPLWPLPKNTWHVPGVGWNWRTNDANCDPACSMSSSAVWPSAKALASASSIWAVERIMASGEKRFYAIVEPFVDRIIFFPAEFRECL